MKRYYLVSGLNDGIEIEPYVVCVTSATNDVTLEIHGGDPFNPRYFDEITKEVYEEMKKEGR